MFIFGLILGILIVISIVIYYKIVKRVRKVAEIVFVNRSVLCLIVFLVNKIFKQHFVAITNTFNDRVHVLSKVYFESIIESDLLYKHELVHVLQVRKHGRFKFLVLNTINFIKFGYDKNPFEVEAYTLEADTVENIKKHFGY